LLTRKNQTVKNEAWRVLAELRQANVALEKSNRGKADLLSDGETSKHVLRHLIDNAVKFTPRGQIKVSSRTLFEDKKVEFEISDTGIGIPREALPAVFEKFQQLDGSATRPYAGLGLGLYVAKMLTELLGGELCVSTELGKDSTFTVALPVA
jgi:signal transduction histidine kinase